MFQAIYITGDYLVTLTDKDDNQIFGLEPIFEFATVTDNAFVRNIDTLAIAIASNDIADGDTLNKRKGDRQGRGRRLERCSSVQRGDRWDILCAVHWYC